MHHTLIRSNELQLRSHKKGERPKTKVSAPPTSSFQGKPTLHSSFLPYIFLFPIPSKKNKRNGDGEENGGGGCGEEAQDEDRVHASASV